jgi:hypothetical protein
MKNTKTNLRRLEKFIRTMSKGYYSDFTEYHPDHTKPDDTNDHSKVIEENDHSFPDIKKLNTEK